jgi:hypothetical protein
MVHEMETIRIKDWELFEEMAEKQYKNFMK